MARAALQRCEEVTLDIRMRPIAFGFSRTDGDAGLCRNGVRAARARLHRGVLQRTRQVRLIRLHSAVSVSTNGLAIIAVVS